MSSVVKNMDSTDTEDALSVTCFGKRSKTRVEMSVMLRKST